MTGASTQAQRDSGTPNRMHPLEFKAVREFLGLDHEWIAASLGLKTPRQVRRWEAGTAPIPDGVRVQVEGWEEEAAQIVHGGVVSLLDMPEPVLGIPREGELGGWPAKFWRLAAMRIALEVPGLAFTERDTPGMHAP